MGHNDSTVPLGGPDSCAPLSKDEYLTFPRVESSVFPLAPTWINLRNLTFKKKQKVVGA